MFQVTQIGDIERKTWIFQTL